MHKKTEKEEKNVATEDSFIVEASAGGNEEKRQAMQVAEDAREANYTHPSFGAQLFMGHFDPSLVYPFPLQSEEDKKIGDEIIEKFSKYLEENLDPEEVDATRTIPKKVIEEMGRQGIFALKVPKEYGGMGLSQVNYNRLVHRVASYCGGTAVLISAHQSIGVPQPLKMYGTEEQKKKFFPRFRQGQISAFALTEVEVGSDPAQMKTTATPSEDGKYYTINGTKLWCTNGALADVMVVMALTPPKFSKGKEKRQISAFIVETNTPGVEVAHRCEFMGLGGIYNALIKFTNVKVPAENLLWAEGRGLALALGTINVGRLTLPAACTGGAKQCLSIARRWGKDRVQWGLPVGLHEAGREKIAYIASTTFAMDAITWLTSAWADQGNVDIRIEAAMAKLFCTEAMWKIVDMTMQLRGGRGYEKGRSLAARGEPNYPVERMMRDCRINMILEGSSEIMKLFLAREAIDPHLKRALGLVQNKSIGGKLKTVGNLLGFYAGWYPKQWFGWLFGPSYKDLGEMGQYFAYINDTSHQLARSIFHAMARYQQGLEKREMLLGRLMEIGTDLFAMAATASYAATLYKKNPKDRSPLDLASYFCAMAERRISKRFDDIASNDDKHANKLAKQVIDGESKWLENNVIWAGPRE